MSKKTKDLVIVESPAKSQTISNYLGSGYRIESSMGHIRDLNPHILSIDVEKNYAPHYEVSPSKKAIVNKLKKAARQSGTVLLATDPDREGEAIAFHLQQLLKDQNSRIRRIFFNEITRDAIHRAIQSPRDLDMDKVNSQQMRRLLDRLAGYKISPVLQKKIGGPLSAGRVQSIALKLIVKREEDIEAFRPREYWTIEARLEGSRKPPFSAELAKLKNRKIDIPDAAAKDKILKDLEKRPYILSGIKKQIKTRRPAPPFITSTLQQMAYSVLKYPVKRTMRIAQQLYEGIPMNGSSRTGLITYMRTDSHRLSKEARSGAREFIKNRWGPEYVPEKFNVFGKKTKTQDAHEAIRPTLPFHSPEKVKRYLDGPQYKLYEMIWNRFFASQMKGARIAQTTFDIQNGDYHFKTKGEIITFQGFLVLQRPSGPSQILPELKEKETLILHKILPEQHFTSPPKRYTEASLVKLLEKNGIGRPSTYATIIDILNKREYVVKEDKKFLPTVVGRHVVRFLDTFFDDIMNVNFTANLETELDSVSRGELEWKTGIDRFYKKLKGDLDQINLREKTPVTTGKKCPQCGKELVMKYSYKTRGWFTACSGYPDCRYIHRETGAGEEEKLNRKCPQCGSPLIKRYSPKTRSHFIGCSAYPRCRFIENLQEDMGKCPVCEKPLVKRFSKKTRRPFIACSGYPDCTYIQKSPGRKTKG